MLKLDIDFSMVLNPLSVSIALIHKPVNQFAVQINWLDYV